MTTNGANPARKHWMNMNQLSCTAAALVALALAACNKTADPNVAEMANDTLMANVEIAANASDNTAAGTNATANAATPAKVPTSIPAEFHGRWGLTPADCTSTRGDAKGLLTINDARLTFYESKGTLDKILGATATSFDANYGFSGEGQSWERVERLKMVDGKLNRRTDAKAGQEPPVDLTYSRCAN